jgi:hypothetical protein
MVLLLKNLTTNAGASQNNYLPKTIFVIDFADLEPRDAYDLGVETMMQKLVKHAKFADAIRRILRSPEEIWAEPPITDGLPLV